MADEVAVVSGGGCEDYGSSKWPVSGRRADYAGGCEWECLGFDG